jgi:hypothetical protein
MSLIFEQRSSDSPYVETVTRGWTVGDGTTIRPSEVHWHMVFTRYNGCTHPIYVGPLTAAGEVSWSEGAEIMWVKFSLGAFMPHLPVRDLLDNEAPGVIHLSFRIVK